MTLPFTDESRIGPEGSVRVRSICRSDPLQFEPPRRLTTQSFIDFTSEEIQVGEGLYSNEFYLD